MTKRKGIFEVNVDVRKLLEEPSSSCPAAALAPELEKHVLLSKSVTITDALSVIIREMEVNGNRSCTIRDYALYVQQFQRATEDEHLYPETVENR